QAKRTAMASHELDYRRRVPRKLIRAIVKREPDATPTNNAHRGLPAYLLVPRHKKTEAEASARINEAMRPLQQA
ncbi:hypothetical protein AAIJ07_30365, partial [Pseudomonas aeruginosa]|uniref:hypothetical protein n=1 Tax=Pseudomonas aeruginosa TaxID=287 RepID=UPI0031B675AE